jgi:hypothetical protein
MARKLIEWPEPEAYTPPECPVDVRLKARRYLLMPGSVPSVPPHAVWVSFSYKGEELPIERGAARAIDFITGTSVGTPKGMLYDTVEIYDTADGPNRIYWECPHYIGDIRGFVQIRIDEPHDLWEDWEFDP